MNNMVEDPPALPTFSPQSKVKKNLFQSLRRELVSLEMFYKLFLPLERKKEISLVKLVRI